jgi:MFS family permease
MTPPPQLQRLLIVQSLSYAVGSGFYAAGSIVFFTVYTSLSATQVALGLSIAGAVALAMRVPFGMLADRIGGRTSWLLGAAGQAILFATYPFIHGYLAFVIVVSLVGLAAVLGNAGRGRYLGEVIEQGHRVKVNAYLRSVVNIGMALGTAVAGFVVAVQSRQAMATIVLVNAASFVVDVVLLMFFIAPGKRGAGRKNRPSGRAALKDGPFVVLSLVNGIFVMSDTVLTVVIPLWILRETDAPRSLISIVLLVNMTMVSLLQVWASSGSEEVAGAAVRQRRAGLLLVVGCLLVPISAYTADVVTWVVLLATAVLMTLSELLATASAWGLGYALSPESRRGEYLAVFGWGGQFADIAGPAGMTALALSFVPGGWLVIAGIFLTAAVAARPVASWVERSRRAESAPAPEPVQEGVQ